MTALLAASAVWGAALVLAPVPWRRTAALPAAVALLAPAGLAIDFSPYE